MIYIVTEFMQATYTEQDISDTMHGISHIEENFEYEQLNELA
jgi:hypothetical protein